MRKSMMIAGAVSLTVLVLAGCRFGGERYEGSLDLTQYDSLKGKRIFIDPGHGVKGKFDLSKMEAGGTQGEDLNLAVGLLLGRMLESAGALVSCSRTTEDDVPLRKRADLAVEFAPDLLLSISHRGSRRADRVNHPSVLIWGSPESSPASHDFASLLLNELERVMERKGRVMSDFTLYPAGGARILHETRDLCPGVIGEAAFFTDTENVRRLGDRHYLLMEAEAYFLAAAAYFRKGVPSGRVLFSSEVRNDGMYRIDDERPLITVELDGGSPGSWIDRDSFRAELDGLPVGHRFIAGRLCVINYGDRLHPGFHTLRFSVRNSRGQSSMIQRAEFATTIRQGDFIRLSGEGERLLSGKGRWIWRKKGRIKRKILVADRSAPREGLRMLLAALSMARTDPGADRLLWNIARGFRMIGEHDRADHALARLFHYYPQSDSAAQIPQRIRNYRFPLESTGRPVQIVHDTIHSREKTDLKERNAER